MANQTEEAIPHRSRTSIFAKLVVGIGVMITLVAGIFVLGRAASSDRVAIVLTTIWFVLVLAFGLLVTRRRADLRMPMAGGYAIVGVSALVWLGLPMLRDDEVSQRVVSAVPAAEAPGVSGNVLVASGEFTPIAHTGSGTAAIVELPNGERKLTLTDFATDNGPDLRVYLATEDPDTGAELGEFEDLGALAGNVGDQQYDVPGAIDIDRFSKVVIWCRAFSVGFTSAQLDSA